jgi:hypothetical protein
MEKEEFEEELRRKKGREKKKFNLKISTKF